MVQEEFGREFLYIFPALIVGLAVDSVTGMLYGLDFQGSVFECDTRTSSNSRTCETFASGGGLAPGLALDPTHR